MPETATRSLEWQIANGSGTAHVIDLDRPSWCNADGSRRRTGPRSICGRSPQRNADGIWWSWPTSEPFPWPRLAPQKRCGDCLTALASDGAGETRAGR